MKRKNRNLDVLKKWASNISDWNSLFQFCNSDIVDSFPTINAMKTYFRRNGIIKTTTTNYRKKFLSKFDKLMCGYEIDGRLSLNHNQREKLLEKITTTKTVKGVKMYKSSGDGKYYPYNQVCIDHINPIFNGGKTSLSNLQCLDANSHMIKTFMERK